MGKWAEQEKGGFMSKKNVWSEMYESFRSLYPSLKKEAIGYCPHGCKSILIYFPGGLRMVYNEIEHRARIITT